MRKVPLRNYLILAVIIIVTIVLSWLLADYYKKVNFNNSILYENISQLTEEELTDYIIEKPVIFMYISNKNNLNNNDFEQALLKKIKENNIKDDFVFVDVNSTTENFIKFFKDNYNIDLDINRSPIILLISDGKIIKVNYIDIYNYDMDSILGYEGLK